MKGFALLVTQRLHLFYPGRRFRKTFPLISRDIVFMEFVLFDQTDQFLRVFRICGIPCLLESARPSFIVRRIEIEEEPVSVAEPQKIRVVTERLLSRAIFAEAFPFPVIVIVHLGTVPVMAFDSEMVIGLQC